VEPGSPADRRRRALLALAALLWLAALPAAYFTPLWRWLAGSHRGLPHLFQGDLHLPYLRAATTFAARALGGAALLVASALVLGRAALAALGVRPATRREAAAVSAALGIGLFALAGLGLAALGLYRPAVLRALSLLAAAARFLVRRSSPPRLPPFPAGTDRLWAACAALALGSALVAALAPVVEYDALWYHLYFPRLSLAQGHLVDLPTEYPSLFPMGWGLWFGYGLAWGGSGTAVLLHFACLPLLALATFELARRFAPGASPWLAVALLATAPTVIWEASTAYVDLGLALDLTVAVHALLRFAEDPEEGRAWLPVGGLALGLALATKHVALLALALLAPGLALLLVRRGRPARQALAAALLFGVLALLPALPWYVRSWAATGDPVHPQLYGLLGAPAERWDDRAAQGLARFLSHFGRPRTLSNQLTLPWDLTFHPSRYDGTLGPLSLLFFLLLPFLALALGGGGWAIPWLLGFAAGYFALWASPLASFQLRWLLPIAPLLAVLAAAAFARLAALVREVSGRAGAALLSAFVALLLLLGLPPFTRLHERDRAEWNGWINSTLHGLPYEVVIGAVSRPSYLARHLPTWAAWRFANRTLPAGARVLAWSGGDQYWSGRDYLNVFSPLVRDAAWAPAGEEPAAFARLRALGVTHLLFQEDFLRRNGFPATASWDDYALSGTAGRRDWCRLLYSDGRASLYALLPTAP
jgi:hypothetical protein